MADIPSLCISRRPEPAGFGEDETLSPSGWAWEFLRRHPELRRAAEAERNGPEISYERDGTVICRLQRRSPSAESWGLCCFPNPTLSGNVTPVFWRKSVYRRALSARPAVTCLDPRSAVCLADIPGRKCLLIKTEGDAKLAVEGHAFNALITFEGKLSAVPQGLTLAVDHGGLGDLETRLDALQAFIDYCQQRFQPPRPERGFAPHRLRESLIALDAKLAGASLRQISDRLMDPKIVAEDWTHGSRYTRERARRTVCRGLELMNGGWRDLLK